MTQNDTKTENVKKLYELHEIAIEMRYAGNTYEEISKALTDKFDKNHTPGKVRRWFQSGGMLDKPYFDYAKKENERRRQYMMNA